MEISKKEYFKNVIWLFFERGVYILGGLFIGIWVARYLGPSDYGLLNYAIAFSAIFGFLSKLGLDRIAVRELTRKPEKKDEIIGTIFFMKLAGGALAVGLIFFIILATKFDEKMLIITTFLVSLSHVVQSLDVIDYYYQSKVLSKYVVIARNSGYLVSILLQIFFILGGYPVEYFGLAFFLNFAMASFFMLLIYLKTDGHILKWKFRLARAKRLIADSWPLMISGFLIIIQMRIDQLMVDHFLGFAQLGIYSVAVRMVELWYMVPTVLASTLMPYFVKIRERDNGLYRGRMRQFFSIMFWMGALVGAGTILFGQQVIDILYGAEYHDAYKALVFNVWSLIFVSQAYASGIYLIAENIQKYRLYISVFAVALNISLNLIFIQFYGISGAALATFCTQFLVTWIISLLFKPLRMITFDMIKSANPVYLLKVK